MLAVQSRMSSTTWNSSPALGVMVSARSVRPPWALPQGTEQDGARISAPVFRCVHQFEFGLGQRLANRRQIDRLAAGHAAGAGGVASTRTISIWRTGIEPLLAARSLEGQRLQAVADQQRGRLCRIRHGRSAAATQHIVVHAGQVVVDQRIDVDAFDGAGGERRALPAWRQNLAGGMASSGRTRLPPPRVRVAHRLMQARGNRSAGKQAARVGDSADSIASLDETIQSEKSGLGASGFSCGISAASSGRRCRCRARAAFGGIGELSLAVLQQFDTRRVGRRSGIPRAATGWHSMAATMVFPVRPAASNFRRQRRGGRGGMKPQFCHRADGAKLTEKKVEETHSPVKIP